MADDIEVGSVRIPVFADTQPFDREIQNDLKSRASRAARDVGRRMGGDIVEGLKLQYRARIADARESFARGLIDKREFERQGRIAADAFNKGIIGEIERLGSTGRLTQQRFIELTESMKKVGQEGQRIGTNTRGSLENLQGWIRGTFVVGFLALFTGMVTRAGRLLEGLGQRTRDVLELGGERLRTRESFESIAGARGLDPVEVTNDLRRALRAMVGDVTLWRNANKALLAELPVTSESMAEMAFLARRMAESVGRDGTEAFTRLVDGIAKGEQAILEELNLMTRLETAVQNEARARGVNADTWDQQTKIAIFFNAVMEEMREKVALMGEDSLDSGERVKQLTTFVDNLKGAAAEAVAESPAFSSFLSRIGTDAESSAGRVQELANRIGAFADTVAEAGERALRSPLGDVMRFGFGVVAGNFASQGRAASDLTGLDEVFQRNLRRREIETADSIEEIDNLRIRNLTQIRDLLREDAEANAARVKQLRLELTLMNSKRAELARINEEAGTGTDRPTPEDPQIRRQREQIQQSIADSFFALSHSAVDVELRALDQLEDRLREVGGLTDEWASRIDALRERTRDQGAFGELQAALQSLPEEGNKRVAGLEALHARASELIRGLDESSDLWAQLVRFLQLVEQESEVAAAALNRVKKATEIDPKSEAIALSQKENALAAERISLAQEHARAIEQGARGALQIAEALGVIDSRVSQALQGAAQLASSLVEIASLMQAGQGIGLGPILGVLGAGASIISAIRNDGEAGERRAQQLIDSQANLIRALDELAGAVLSGMTTSERDRVLSAAGSVLSDIESQGALEPFIRDRIDDPRVLADLRRLQEVTGITFLDGNEVEDLEALRRAIEALQELGLSGFGDDLTGQLDRIDWLFDTLGDSAGDAADRLALIIKALRDTADTDEGRSLATHLSELFASGGADAVTAFLDALATRFAAGDESLFERGGAFFGMTREEALRFLEELRAAATGGGIVGGGSNVQRLAVNITEAQGSQLVSLASTQVHHLAAIRAALEGRSLPAIPTPSAAALAPAGMGGVTYNLDIDVSVAGDVTDAGARALGGSIASQVVEQLGVRTAQKWRGAGRFGSPKLTGNQ